MAVTNILCQTKRWFAFSKIGFCAGTKVFEETVKFLGWLKKFGPAQNILGPVKVQGISFILPEFLRIYLKYLKKSFNFILKPIESNLKYMSYKISNTILKRN